VRVTVQGSRGQDEDEAASLLIRPMCAPYGLHVASARAQGRVHFAHVLFSFFSGISFSDLSYNRHSRNFHTPWLYTEKLLCQFPQSFENKCETIAINFSEISFTRSIRRDGCRPIIGKLTREADIRR